MAIKYGIKHKLLDDFEDDMLAVEIETRRGKTIISTAYYPPRRPILNRADFSKIMRKPCPVYFIGDLNAKHIEFEHQAINLMGRTIMELIERGIMTHLGPDVNTIFNHMGTGSPDIILGNRYSYLNSKIERGPLTSSDHFLIKMTLSVNPIVT